MFLSCQILVGHCFRLLEMFMKKLKIWIWEFIYLVVAHNEKRHLIYIERGG